MANHATAVAKSTAVLAGIALPVIVLLAVPVAGSVAPVAPARGLPRRVASAPIVAVACASSDATVYLPFVQRATAPAIVGRIAAEVVARVAAADGRAYLLSDATMTGRSSVVVVDVTDPSHPTRLGSTGPLPGLGYGLVVSDERMYVLTADPPAAPDWQPAAALHIYAVPGDPDPAVLGTFALPFVVTQLSMGADVAPTRWFAVDRGIAYIATGNAGDPGGTPIRILDATDPTRVREIASVALPDSVLHVTYAAGYVYATGPGINAMHVIDVRDPGRPRLVASPAVSEALGDSASVLVAVERTTAYAVMGRGDPGMPGPTGTLRLFDVADPERPRMLADARRSDGDPGAVATFGDSLYVLGPGLEVFDVSDPARPWRTESLSGTWTWGLDMAVDTTGRRLLQASSHGLDVHALDSVWPAMGTYRPLGTTHGAAARGRFTYVPTDAGLRVVDTSDPTHPRTAALVDEVGPVDWAKMDRGYLLVVTARGMNPTPRYVHYFDLTDPGLPRAVGRLRVASLDYPNAPPYDIADGVLWMLGATDRGAGEMIAVDVTGAYGPRELGSVSFENPIVRFALDGDRAYGVLERHRGPYESALVCVDVSDPSHPTVLGRSPWSEYAVQTIDADPVIDADGEIVVVGAGSLSRPRLHVYDVSNPATPREVGRDLTHGAVGSVRLDGNTVWLTSTESSLEDAHFDHWLARVGLADPSMPVELGRVMVDGSARLAPAPGRVLLVGPANNRHGMGLAVVE